MATKIRIADISQITQIMRTPRAKTLTQNCLERVCRERVGIKTITPKIPLQCGFSGYILSVGYKMATFYGFFVANALEMLKFHQAYWLLLSAYWGKGGCKYQALSEPFRVRAFRQSAAARNPFQ